MHSLRHFELVTTIASDRRRQAATGGWSPVAPASRRRAQCRSSHSLMLASDGCNATRRYLQPTSLIMPLATEADHSTRLNLTA